MNWATIKRKYLPKFVGFGLNSIGLVMPKKAAEIALDIFRTPRDGRIQSYQKKFLKKFKQVTLDYKGIPIMTYDNGKSGRKVLLCHGWESNSFRWRKLYRALKDTELNVIMVDAPAHGGSGSDRFDALIYAEVINVVSDYYKPQVVLGHSVGGYAAILYAYQHQPEFVEKLIILASPDKLEDISNRYFDIIGLGRRVANAYQNIIFEKFGNQTEFYSAADFSEFIDIDGLIIHDREDTINMFYEAEAIHAKWKNSKLIETKDLGHSLQNEEVYKIIISSILLLPQH